MTANSRIRNTMAPRGLVVAALTAAAALSLGGCGRGDENAKAIEKAKRDMETLAATYDAGLSKGLTYDKVVSDLSKAADSKRPGEAAAARLIRSSAYVREGDASMDDVVGKEREARVLEASIRSARDNWLDLNAQAQALRKFDPEKGLKEVDDQLTAKGAEIEQTNQSLAKAQEDLKSLQDRAAAAQQKSRSQRDKELEIRNQMISKSQTERAELVRQANEARRTGDGFDLEASDLLAEANRQIPSIAELQLRVRRLETQRTMLEASKKELQEAAARAVEQSERALKGAKEGGVEYVGAEQVAQDLGKLVGQLDELRAGIPEPADKADGLYNQALSEVKRAQAGAGAKGGPTGVDTKLAEAGVHHASADLLLTRARGLEKYAELLKMLAETKPALADSRKYAEESNKATEEAKAKLAASKDAFTAAQELYEQAGASQKAQDVKERLEQIAQALVAFGNAPKAEPAQPEEGAAGAQTPTAEKPAAEKPGEAPKAEVSFEGEKADVFALLQKLADAMKAKNPEGMMQYVVFRNSQQEETFRKMVPLLVKEEELSAACVERFGQGFEDLVSDFITQNGGDASKYGQAKIPGIEAFHRLERLDPADLEIKIQTGGSEAEVSFKSARTTEPIECMKVDSSWKVKLDFEIDRQVSSDSFLHAYQEVTDKIIENIKNGEYASDSQKMVKDYFQELFKKLADLFKSHDENK